MNTHRYWLDFFSGWAPIFWCHPLVRWLVSVHFSDNSVLLGLQDGKISRMLDGEQWRTREKHQHERWPRLPYIIIYIFIQSTGYRLFVKIAYIIVLIKNNIHICKPKNRFWGMKWFQILCAVACSYSIGGGYVEPFDIFLWSKWNI